MSGDVSATAAQVAEPWRLAGGVWAGPSPFERDALVRGPFLGLRYHATQKLFVSAAVAVSWSTAATQLWRLSRVQGLATAGVGMVFAVGAGTAFAQARGGVQGVGETARRHGARELQRFGIDIWQEGWSVEPYGAVDLGVEVGLAGGWQLQCVVGPAISWRHQAGGDRTRWGIHGRLGAGYAL